MGETTVSILQNASMKTGNSNYVVPLNGSYNKLAHKATKSTFGSREARVSFDEGMVS